MRGTFLPALFLGAGTGLVLASVQRVLGVLLWPRIGMAVFVLSLFGAGLGATAAFLTDGKGRGEDSWPPWVFPAWGLAVLGVLYSFPGGLPLTWPGMSAGLPDLPLTAYILLAAPLCLTSFAIFAGSGAGRALSRTGWCVFALGGAFIMSPLFSTLHPRVPALAGLLVGMAPAFFGARDKKPTLLKAATAAAMTAVVAMLLAGIGPGPFDDASVQTTGGDGPDSPWGESRVAWSGPSRMVFTPHEQGWVLLTVNGGLREDILRPPEATAPAVPLSRGPDDTVDILFVGFPKGSLLKRYLAEEKARLTILEPDRVLVREVVEHWPALKEQSGRRVRFVEGNPRRFLEKDRRRYDMIALSDTHTKAAHLASALCFSENTLATVEAFRLYVESLEPRGLLFVERAGMGRVISTLREAVGGGGDVPFADQVVVYGKKGGLISQGYFRPDGFSRGDLKALRRAAKRSGADVMYSPLSWWRWNLYLNLVRGEKVKGYYFSTPVDLVPARDKRPFLAHFGRLMISPAAPPLPEEKGFHDQGWGLRFIPKEDRIAWTVMAAGMLLMAASLCACLAVYQRRTGLARRALPQAGVCIILGVSVAAGLRSLAAYGRWLDPFTGATPWVAALFVIAAGAGLTRVSTGGSFRKAAFPAAALFALIGIGGYSLRAPALAAGPVLWGVFLASAGLSAGWLAGRVIAAALAGAEGSFPGTAPWLAGTLLLTAAAGWPASDIAAVTFGFPLLWLLAAAGVLAALHAGRP